MLTSSRLLRDVGYFKTRVDKLDGSGDIGDYLLNIVNEKSIEAEPHSRARTPEPNRQSVEIARTNSNSEKP